MGLRPETVKGNAEPPKWVCSNCRHAITATQDRVWSTNPRRLGLIHANRADCREPRS